MNKSTNISARLLLARRESGLSQDDLGKKIGRGRNTINRWERGHSAPDIDEIALIAEATRKDVAFFSINQNPQDKNIEIFMEALRNATPEKINAIIQLLK